MSAGALRLNAEPSERKKEVFDLLTKSAADFAKDFGTVISTLLGKFSDEQKKQLRRYDYNKHYDISDKREKSAYSKVIKNILSIAYPYEGSDTQYMVDLESDVLGAISDLDLSDDYLRSIDNTDAINELLKYYVTNLLTDLGIEETIDILPPEHRIQSDFPIEPIDPIDRFGEIDPEKYKMLIKQYLSKLGVILQQTGATIISSNTSKGGNKSVLLNKTESRTESGLRKYSGFVAISVNGRVILEPVGQYGNRTYIVPQDDVERCLEALSKNGRNGVMREIPGATRLNHSDSLPNGDERVFSFDDHLFKCIKAIQDDIQPLSGPELKKKIRKTVIDFKSLRQNTNNINRNEE